MTKLVKPPRRTLIPLDFFIPIALAVVLHDFCLWDRDQQERNQARIESVSQSRTALAVQDAWMHDLPDSPHHLATKAVYDTLKMGISPRQAVQRVGKPFTRPPRVEILSAVSKKYYWDDAEGSHLTLDFRNGKMISKSLRG